jgi:sporulation protein YlmC with PRC-barrel domain
MKKVGIILMALVLLGTPAVLFAQQQDQQPPAPEGEQAQQPPPAQQDEQAQPQQGEQAAQAPPAEQARPQLAPPFVALTTMIGMPISAGGSDNAGSVQDAWLTGEGMVSHIVANLQNVPGVNPGAYLLDPQTITMQDSRLTLNLTGEPLRSAEGAKGAGVVAQDSVRASQLVSFNLVNEQGQNIGSIEDVVINAETGEIAYVAVNFSGILGAGEKLFAVPYSEVWYSLGRSTVTIYNINQQALEANPGFDRENWPEQANPDWNRAA